MGGRTVGKSLMLWRYARDALRWVVEKGILKGLGNGKLNPKGLAARAQAVQMLKNYFEEQ